MRNKIIFAFLITLFSCTCFAQVYVTNTTTLWPNSDSAWVVKDSIVVTINQESGTVQINVKNFPNSSAMMNDTAILDIRPKERQINMYDGWCVYTILFTAKTQSGTMYYLKGPIHYIDVRPQCILIAFTKVPNAPIMLTGF